MKTKNTNFFAGLEDDEEQFEEANFVDQNLDDDGEIEPVITEEDVPEDGKSPDADVVSVEDFDHFFNNDDLGFEDDEDAAIDEGDGGDEAPTVNVSVDIETGDDDGGEDVGDDAGTGDETDAGSDDAAGEESYDIFGFEDDDPVDQAAEVSDDGEGEGDDAGTGDETDAGTDDGDDAGAGDDDISVDVNINVNVDDGTSGDDGDDAGADTGAEEPPAADSGEISQEDFDFGTMGLEDDTPEVNVEVTIDGEEQETVSTSDDGDGEATSDDPVDQAAELSDDGEGSEEPDPEEAGTEEDEDDDLGEESLFDDLW